MSVDNFEVMNEDFEPTVRNEKRTGESLLKTATRLTVENPVVGLSFRASGEILISIHIPSSFPN